MAIVGWVSSVHSMFYQGALSTFAPGKVAHPARRRQTWSQVPPPTRKICDTVTPGTAKATTVF